ncbi:hypothetical protein DEU56DRAFT_909007 [Suillus clintonianus]|uniref:uncharacterized protein n=1 Tax=Suillus clintonianus TaxID=1904413 RepID=UPI001B86A9B6|nr:uncharacterized protein DEU56DRAFT_909007 [Suillus clintonianus]KAG2149316.1 hypothetical protein DEU56DRAFT_909007 [Suillus clintonianus]
MSASPFPEPLDAPMHDFATEIDVPMNPAATQDFFVELSMDHDGHHTSYSQEDVEVDMETYYDGNAEYEMADETEEFSESHYHHEPLDVEVYDASDARSPQPIPDSLPLPSLTVIPEISLLSSPVPFSDPFTPQLATIPIEHDASSTDRPVGNDRPVAEEADFSAQREEEPLAVTLEQLLESDPLHLTTAVDRTAAELNIPSVAFVDLYGVEKHADALVSETTDRAESCVQPTDAEPTLQSQVEEQSETLHPSDVPSDDSVQHQGEPHLEGLHEEADNANDPHEISDGVYIDPPPAVFLSIGSSEVPEYCLFNQPPVERGSRSPSAGASNQQAYALLLENRPTLYYEPLSCVFEALRLDEVISKIPDSPEGELVIDAYDLQLAVLEDNVYAQEISLHDLNVLHDGSDFKGPLRIHLRSAIPRFILRYRLLQEQISRLDLAGGVEENVPEEGLYSSSKMSNLSLNVDDNADHHDTVQEVDYPEEETQHEALLPDDEKDFDGAEGVHEPEVPLDQLQGDDVLAKDVTLTSQAVADVTYYSISGDVAQALGEEDGYECTNVGTEYQEEGEGDLDVTAVHEPTDTDAAGTVSKVNSQFGGEDTEYHDYIQPGEYGENYDDFPEEDGGHTEFGYDQTVGYEESGTEVVSTIVEESQAGLPSSDLRDEETTPVPPAQRVDSEPAQRSDIVDSASNELGDCLSSHESFDEEKNSNPTDKDLIVDQDIDQPESAQFPTDESDSNFLAMLEREADFELDHSSANTNANPTEEGVGETLPVLEEEWDKWDDELDGDGEVDDEWVDPGDAVSNESSVTLSSNSSAKRSHDEVDPEEGELETDTPQSSPGMFQFVFYIYFTDHGLLKKNVLACTETVVGAPSHFAAVLSRCPYAATTAQPPRMPLAGLTYQTFFSLSWHLIDSHACNPNINITTIG